jgi:hypothetical protein
MIMSAGAYRGGHAVGRRGRRGGRRCPSGGPARGPEPWRQEPGGGGLHGAAFEGGWTPAGGWRRGVSEGVEPSEWALHDKIDEQHPFWVLKNEDEPPGPGRPEGGAPLPGGPQAANRGTSVHLEREVRRAPTRAAR